MSASDPDASVGSAELPGGQGVFYADSAPATDVVLAPISIGLESVYQLRAPESPERLEMTLTLPDGASLQPAGDGGIEVEQGGHSIANVSQPQAVDATGNPVAAIMTADENSIELDVPHSDAEVAYPIAVTTMATAVGSSTNPKLGYNFIVRGDDAASNWKTAHDDGNATWARVAVGPGQVSAAKQALLVPLIQIGRPTTCDPAVDKYCKLLPGSASTYGDTCHDAASSYGGGYGTSFEVINEPNHPVGDGWSAKPLYPDAYATLFRACYNAIKSAKPEAPVLGGSVVRSFNPDLGPDGMDWAEYEYEFGSATFANGDRIRDLSYIVSSHLYPRTCLGSYADMDTCMGNWLGWDKALMGEANGDPRRAWVTEFGIKDGWKGCGTAGYKEFWLQHGFEFLGDTYDVPIVFVFRFTRNRPAFWLDPSLLIDSWGDSGVYDSTLNSGDPADGVNGYYGGHQSCGFTTLATAAANEPG